MDLRQGIMATAQSLGINPIDLATAISYETGGTFNPTQPGPHTQWGQHRGLIQFGEPQAKKYGVDWNDPVGSQLGPNGAVANYLRDTGVKPGMGLRDIYSAINAGAVGRYTASDENNGGAKGDVNYKVDHMGAHRAKAEQLFAGPDGPKGQESYPAPTPFGSMSPRPSGMSIDPIAASLYPEGEKKGKSFGSRLQAFGQALDTPAPAPVGISGGGGGDARASGDALLKAMQTPSMYAQMFMKKRII